MPRLRYLAGGGLNKSEFYFSALGGAPDVT